MEVGVDIEWAIAATALLVGVMVGLTGVGAGAVMTPVLVGFFGISLPVAIATDLLFATITKIVGIAPHHRQGSINWSLAKSLWWGSIPGALVGVGIVLVLAEGSYVDWLIWPLGAIVFITAVTLAKRALSPITQLSQETIEKPRKAPHILVPPLGGFGIGTAVSLTSVGAGALGMALLVRISPPGTNPRELVGTDLVHAIPIALIAGGAYGLAGLVSWPLLASLLVGSLPGVIVGSVLSGRAPARALNGLLAVMLFSAVVLLLLK